MKISELWLREWVNPSLTLDELCERLTMAGLEIEETLPAENNDHVIDIAITPNRGDCLSILGMAHEIAALTNSEVHVPEIFHANIGNNDTLPIVIREPEDCSHYVGRVIKNVTADAVTPVWMQERLRHSGINSISAVVDIMNYVMLELGQPMHAFDLAKISGGIEVRKAKPNETLELLDGVLFTADQDTLVIADQKKPLAIAGVMGGLESAVTLLTRDIFLESAFFRPECIARTSRQYKLNSDSSYRFERGVDPELQSRAILRATQLIVEIVGGQPGPVIDVSDKKYFPQPKTIHLRAARITKMSGIKIPPDDVENILLRLGFSCKKNNDNWDITVPARRFDITAEIDLIEEIIRLYGYEKVPLHQPVSEMQISPFSEKKLSLTVMRRVLCDAGYQEVITYSFVDKKMLAMLDPTAHPLELMNPVTIDMNVMRTTLWAGLINTLLYNQNRQQSRVRLFETGLRFISVDGTLSQQRVLSGLVSGDVLPEQWGVQARWTDFYDLKGDLENLFRLTLTANEFEFKAGTHPALHPGQTAEIYRAGHYVGIMGALHPALIQSFDIQGKVFVFELLLDILENAKLPRFTAISKFPEIRRDIAILVDRTVPARLIQDTIIDVAGDLLQDINIFDVYQGKGIANERKSVALSLILQHASRTLVDEEVATLMERVIIALKERFAAELRG